MPIPDRCHLTLRRISSIHQRSAVPRPRPSPQLPPVLVKFEWATLSFHTCSSSHPCSTTSPLLPHLRRRSPPLPCSLLGCCGVWGLGGRRRLATTPTSLTLHLPTMVASPREVGRLLWPYLRTPTLASHRLEVPHLLLLLATVVVLLQVAAIFLAW